MAKYDEDPSFAGMFPTGETFNAHDSALTAPGSPGIPAREHSGQVLGTASGSSVVGPGANASRMPQLDEQVSSGDSNSFSDGIAAHTSAITGEADQAQFMDSGAGAGHVNGPTNKNSMWGPGPMYHGSRS